MRDTPAIRDIVERGIPHEVVEYGRVTSVEEAAEKRGVEVAQIIKSLVVRVTDERHVLVLVPGDRTISWPRLRSLLGVHRMSMPDAAEAQEVTGYPRGAITPFGMRSPLEVIVDEAVMAWPTVSLGGGDHGVALHLAPDAIVTAFAAVVAAVTEA